VQQNGGSSFVYVISNNAAQLKPIKTGVTDSGVTQVDGINPGDVVATSGFDKLQDKSRVVVVANPPSAASGAGAAPAVAPAAAAP
jgi:multidrug efflux system membrane fusion protein